MSKQGTQEWLQERLGKVTASRIGDMLAKTKTGWGASREAYKVELIVERLSGCATVGYTNAAMQWGTDTEPQAREAYAMLMDTEVTQVGFIPHPTIAMAGASPDGLIGEDGLIEIKCPGSPQHYRTLRGENIDGKYVMQVQFQLACTDRKWCDWVSFDPRMPVAIDGKPVQMQLFRKRIIRDDKEIERIEGEVKAFLAEVDKEVSVWKAHGNLPEQLKASVS